MIFHTPVSVVGIHFYSTTVLDRGWRVEERSERSSEYGRTPWDGFEGRYLRRGRP